MSVFCNLSLMKRSNRRVSLGPSKKTEIQLKEMIKCLGLGLLNSYFELVESVTQFDDLQHPS